MLPFLAIQEKQDCRSVTLIGTGWISLRLLHLCEYR